MPPEMNVAAAPPVPAEIVANWSHVLRPLQTAAAHQTVVNPATTRASLIHDLVLERIADLGAPFQRYVPWREYSNKKERRV